MGRRRKFRTNAQRQAAYRRRKRAPAYFKATRDDWETPAALYRELDQEFSFELDVCATQANAKCHSFFSPEADALNQQWDGVCWMNPPYSGVAHWMAKAHKSSQEGAVVVCLVPARTDTKWWHDIVAPHAEVRFLRGRLRFGDAKHCAPFPSAVVVFRRPELDRRRSKTGISIP